MTIWLACYQKILLVGYYLVSIVMESLQTWQQLYPGTQIHPMRRGYSTLSWHLKDNVLSMFLEITGFNINCFLSRTAFDFSTTVLRYKENV
jgi:hypothetical protein